MIVPWNAEVGDHWIAPLHVHHHDDEAWYVLQRNSASASAETKSLLKRVPLFWLVAAFRTPIANAGDTEAAYLW